MSSAASPSPAEGLRDFSDSLSPMLVREFRQGLRARLFIQPFILLQLASAGAVTLEFVSMRGEEGYSGVLQSLARGQNLFWFAVYVIAGFVMPLRGMDALREETDGRGGELMFIAGLTRWSVARGKWLVQWLLCLLALVSLLPHMLARYFFGGVELLESLVSLVSVAAVCSSFSAVVIGASGHRSVGARFSVIIWCGLILAFVCSFSEAMVSDVARGSVSLIPAVYGVCYVIGLHVFYTVAGIQLARAHLRPYLLPFEGDPRKGMNRFLVFGPFILAAGAFATCGYGSIFVLLILVVVVLMYDSPWRGPEPAKQGTGAASPA